VDSLWGSALSVASDLTLFWIPARAFWLTSKALMTAYAARRLDQSIVSDKAADRNLMMTRWLKELVPPK